MALRRSESDKKPLFDQVLDYLSSLPPESGGSGITLAEEAVAATAVCLRWGSYFAVVADRDKPLWSEAREEGQSQIDDSEMVRINIEASPPWRDGLNSCALIGSAILPS